MDIFEKGMASMATPGDGTDIGVEIWRTKKLIKALEAATGNGTSMISIIIPPGDQITQVSKRVADESGKASNIKSRVNKQSVQAALTSVQQRLKLYSKVPENGLVIYSGTIATEDNREKHITLDFEPFRPINTSVYHCGSQFDTTPLLALLESDDKYGFIVMDGNGALFGLLSGSTRTVLHKFYVDLPKKHGRGGQSALRFARLREEKRHNFVRKVAETAVHHYIPDGQKPSVNGLVLAGSADFKSVLLNSDLFDKRLKAKVVKLVDVSYGGESGFNQAIDLSAEALGRIKFVEEMRLIEKFFSEINRDTNKYCYGIEQTIKALESGAVETLIVWENLGAERYVLVNPHTKEEVIKIMNESQVTETKNFMDNKSKVELDVKEHEPLVEWLATHYKEYGAVLTYVTDKGQEGAQFVKGFGGIGGILRYEMHFDVVEDFEEEDWDEADFF